jgi:7-cyano-7-deazaguanine synthase in queuosine biosynthesis
VAIASGGLPSSKPLAIAKRQNVNQLAINFSRQQSHMGKQADDFQE